MKKKLLFLFYCIPFFVVSQGINTQPVVVSQWWVSELITVVSEYFIEEEAPLITVDFTFTNNNSCSDTIIVFTSDVSNANGSVSYQWDFGDGSSSILTNPSHSYYPPNGCGTTTYNVTLTVTDENDDTDTISYDVLVLESPNVNVTDIDNPFDPFSNCASASQNFLINVGNASDSCISTFSVDWGDGNVENNITFPISHNYSQIGVYQMTFTGVGNNGCTNSITYPVKNVSNPAGGLVSPGNTNNLCAPTEELVFSITSWGENSDDTTYNVDYGDGTTISYSQLDLKASPYYDSSTPSNSANFPIPHIYSSSSCPEGGYDLTLTITNACDTTTSQLLNITVLSNADPDFVWTGNECVGSSILFESSGDLGYGPDCNQTAIYNWDFGDGNTISNGSSSVSHTYTNSGTYDVTLSVEMYCGETTITRQICIEDALTPLFTIDNNEGCTPIQVSTTNNTDTASVCSAETYLWQINYVDDGCGTTPPNWEFINGTDANSLNPEFSFVTPGTYSLTLTVTNACGSTTSAPQDIIVKKPPTVLINAIDDFCGIASVIPTAIIENCTPNASEMIYEWSFPDGIPSTSNLETPGTIFYITPGNHTITLTVTNDCGSVSTTEDFIIYEIPTIIDQPIVSQSLCQGAIPTDLEVVASGGIGIFSYQWYSNTTNSTIGGTLITGATNATYTPPTTTVGILYYYVVISQVDAPDCNVVSDTSEVEVLAAPIFTQQPIGSSVCENGAANQLIVAYSNGTGTPTYQWYSNTTNSTTGGTAITGATSSTYDPPTTPVGMTYYYCIISFTGGGCSEIISDTALVEVTAAVVIDAQPIPTQEICEGGVIATALTVTYSGGTGTVSYQWYENTTNSNTGGTLITGATSSTYTPPASTVSGSLYYYVVISLTGDGCSDAISEVAEIISVPDPIVDSQPLASQSLCQDSSPDNLEVVASGGVGVFEYQWYSNTTNSNVGGTLITGATLDTFTPPTDVVGIFYYYVEISQAPSSLDCFVVSETSEVEVLTAPIFTQQPIGSSVCENGAATILEVVYSDGTGTPTYQWYSNTTNSTTGGTAITGATSSTYDPPTTPVGMTYYYCIISFTGGGCSEIISDTALVEVTAAVVIDSQPIATQEVCIGGEVSTVLTVTYSGGSGTVSYQWYENTTNSNTGGTIITGATTATYMPPVFTTSGTYYYYVTVALDGSGCSDATSAVSEVIVVEDPVVDSQPIVSQSLCQGAIPVDLEVVVSGGTGTFNYQWYSNTTNTTTGGILITGATNAIYTPPTTTVGILYYYVEISQAPSNLDCFVVSETSEVEVTLAPSFILQPVSSDVCINDVATILEVSYSDGIGTPTYQWYSNITNSTTGGTAILGAISSTYDPPTNTVSTLFYYCEISFSSGGCSIIISDTAEVNVSQTPIVSDYNNAVCSSLLFEFDPATILGNTVPTGTIYTWSLPVINPSGAITGATASGTSQAIFSQTLTNITTSPATAIYTVTPISGICVGNTFNIEVLVNPAISVTATIIDSNCFNDNNGSITTTITGGTPINPTNPYIISWSGPNGFTSNNVDITNLEPGIYTLDILDDSSCTFSMNYEVKEPDELLIQNDLLQDISCFGNDDGQISISISGGTLPYTYLWSTLNGSGLIVDAEDQSNLALGNYDVLITDANNCTVTSSFEIIEPIELLISETHNSLDCYGDTNGEIVVVIDQQTFSDYTYLITGTDYLGNPYNGTTTVSDITHTFNGLLAGIYSVTVTDANDCFKLIDTIEITQPSGIVINYTKVDETCFGSRDGSITLNVTGGIPAYIYQWSDFGSGPTRTNLSAGTYTVIVTDQNNCSQTESIEILGPEFHIEPEVDNISCFGENDGHIKLNIVGGISPITVTWNDDTSAGEERNNLSPGTYTVVVTDADSPSCPINETFIITEPAALSVSGNVTNALDCDNVNSGAINLLVSGGTLPLSFSWSNGATSEDLNAIPPGDYTVIVTDANGCDESRSFNVYRPEELELDVEMVVNSNCSTREVEQRNELNITGGIPPYTIQWSRGTVDPATPSVMITDVNGAVLVDVTDSLGCTRQLVFDVELEKIGFPDFEMTSFGFEEYGVYSIDDPIFFTNTSTEMPIEVSWNFGDQSETTNEFSPQHTYFNVGTYAVTLTVTYPYGCEYELTTQIVITQGYDVILPTAFTPNSDGINDTIRPSFFGLKEIEMSIFDTWGQKVYSENNLSLKGWDGMINGNYAENGNYVLSVRVVTFYGKEIKLNTPITLLR